MLSLMNVILTQDPLNSELSKELKYKIQNYSVTLNKVPTTAEKLEERRASNCMVSLKQEVVRK